MTGPATSARRERILSAAEIEFAEHGVDGARIERIAAAAGVNKQLLFHYFESKAGLYRAASEAASQRFDLRSPGGTTLAERLRDLADMLLAAAQTRGKLLGSEWRERAVTEATKLLTDGQRHGFVRDDIDTRPLAEVIVAACFGSSLNAAPERSDPETRDSFRDTVVAVVADFCAWR